MTQHQELISSINPSIIPETGHGFIFKCISFHDWRIFSDLNF